MPTALIAAAIGGVASIAGGAMASSGAKKAADAQAKAAADDLAFQKQQAAAAEARLAPYNTAGVGGLWSLENSMGLNGPAGYADALSKFQTGPGYQYQLDQGIRALEQSTAAQGKLFSGGTGKALVGFGQNLANQQWGNFQNQLANIAQLGQNSAAQTGNQQLGFSGNISNALNNQGTAIASGAAGSANAWSNALAGIGQSFGNYLGQQGNGLGAGANYLASTFGSPKNGIYGTIGSTGRTG